MENCVVPATSRALQKTHAFCLISSYMLAP
eukprot:COSAG03_NODE_6583_length_1037_cov_1.723881_1_plen_29_part_10